MPRALLLVALLLLLVGLGVVNNSHEDTIEPEAPPSLSPSPQVPDPATIQQAALAQGLVTIQMENFLRARELSPGASLVRCPLGPPFQSSDRVAVIPDGPAPGWTPGLAVVVNGVLWHWSSVEDFSGTALVVGEGVARVSWTDIPLGSAGECTDHALVLAAVPVDIVPVGPRSRPGDLVESAGCSLGKIPDTGLHTKMIPDQGCTLSMTLIAEGGYVSRSTTTITPELIRSGHIEIQRPDPDDRHTPTLEELDRLGHRVAFQTQLCDLGGECDTLEAGERRLDRAWALRERTTEGAENTEGRRSEEDR